MGVSAAAASSLDATLAALADPVRRRTVELLSLRPYRAGELADVLGVTRPTMSKHLRVLRVGGIVIDTQPASDTRVRVYQLSRQPFADLQRWLNDAERAWKVQLEAFAAHVRDRHGR